MNADDWLDEQVSGWGVPTGGVRKPGPAVRFYHRVLAGDPLFTDDPAASRAIGIALTVAAAVLAWLLATGQ